MVDRMAFAKRFDLHSAVGGTGGWCKKQCRLCSIMYEYSIRSHKPEKSTSSRDSTCFRYRTICGANVQRYPGLDYLRLVFFPPHQLTLEAKRLDSGNNMK